MKSWVNGDRVKWIPVEDWDTVTSLCAYYDINPYIIAAIGWHETQWGRLGAGRSGFHLGVGVPNDNTMYPQFQGVYNQVNWAAKKIKAELYSPVSWETLWDFSDRIWRPGNPKAWAIGVAAVYRGLMLEYSPTVGTPPTSPAPNPDRNYNSNPIDPDTVTAHQIGKILNITLGNWGAANFIRNLIQKYVVTPVQNAVNHAYDYLREQTDSKLEYWKMIVDWWPKIYAVFTDFIHMIYELFSNRWSELVKFTGDWYDKADKFFSTHWDNADEFLDRLYAQTRVLVKDKYVQLYNLSHYWYNNFDLIVNTYWDMLADFFSNLYSRTKKLVTDYWDKLDTFLDKYYVRVKKLATDYWDKLDTFLDKYYVRVKKLATDYWDKIDKLMGDKFGRLWLLITDYYSFLYNLVTDPKKTLTDSWRAIYEAEISWVFDKLIGLIVKLW